jgi:hypothetical protein
MTGWLQRLMHRIVGRRAFLCLIHSLIHNSTVPGVSVRERALMPERVRIGPMPVASDTCGWIVSTKVPSGVGDVELT